MHSSAKQVLILAHHNYEDLELQYPKYRLREAGFSVRIAGPAKNQSVLGKYGYPQEADLSFDTINPEEYEGAIIPGGFAPDKLRSVQKVLEVVRHFHHKEKLVAYICHGGWVPISAGIVKGIRCTSTPAIKDDLENAGAHWLDMSVVVDKYHVSSRCPDDLPDFCREIIGFLKKQEALTKI